MNLNGVSTLFHYVALHLSPFGKRYGEHDLPQTIKASDCLVRLPNYVGVNVDRVAELVLEYIKRVK